MNSQIMMYEFCPEIARLSDYPHSDSGNWQAYWINCLSFVIRAWSFDIGTCPGRLNLNQVHGCSDARTIHEKLGRWYSRIVWHPVKLRVRPFCESGRPQPRRRLDSLFP